MHRGAYRRVHERELVTPQFVNGCLANENQVPCAVTPTLTVDLLDQLSTEHQRPFAAAAMTMASEMIAISDGSVAASMTCPPTSHDIDINQVWHIQISNVYKIRQARWKTHRWSLTTLPVMTIAPPTTLHLGTQYYRPPFPNGSHWRDDLQLMRDSGLDTVQLWVMWSWVEATPGVFNFDDYDELIAIAKDVGLKVVLSTIAEMQPYWIFREEPGCEMITHTGQPTTSVNRGETHFGCTPGGCTDHPGVWERMARFLTAVVERYVNEPHLVGWDVWNELRWNIEADGRLCYCEHTIAEYHRWLESRYGSLDCLNQAWQRRYSAWDEVWPSRRGNLPYTDSMAWQHFLTARADQHARKRYDLVKAIDPNRPVTVHGGQPSPGYVGSDKFTTLDRGNDWNFADHLDGVGCSSFPIWGNMDDGDFAVRIEYVASASQNKRVWLSELQGGRAANGFRVQRPVTPRDQQRWLWNGYACGADTILFWCWRDEVFGRESAGFGIIGKDGKAEERLGELRVTGACLAQHGPLLANYQPDAAEVGVLFSPQSYYYHWGQEETASRAGQSLGRWCKTLVTAIVPYTVLEETHLSADHLAGLKLIILPRCTALPRSATAALATWVRAGGTLVCEAECGAFTEDGLYHPGDTRWLADLAGLVDLGRRELTEETGTLNLDGTTITLAIDQWSTPYSVPSGGISYGTIADGSLLTEAPAGNGRVVVLGSYAAGEGLGELVQWVTAKAGVQPQIRSLTKHAHVRTGISDGRRVLFVFGDEGCDHISLSLDHDLCSGTPFSELRLGTKVTPRATEDGWQLDIPLPPIGLSVLAEGIS